MHVCQTVNALYKLSVTSVLSNRTLASLQFSQPMKHQWMTMLLAIYRHSYIPALCLEYILIQCFLSVAMETRKHTGLVTKLIENAIAALEKGNRVFLLNCHAVSITKMYNTILALFPGFYRLQYENVSPWFSPCRT